MYKLTQTWPLLVGTSTLVNPQTNPEYLAWLAEGNTPEPADPPPAPDYSAMRHAAYVAESDPIFFMSQRGEATQTDWLAKVAEIKARWPA